MWPYPWTHVGTPSQMGHMDQVAATMPSQAHVGAAQEAPDVAQLEGQDVPLVRPSSSIVKGGIPSCRRYLSTYLEYPVVERSLYPRVQNSKWTRSSYGKSRARADSGSYHTLIEDIKHIAELYLSRESDITE